MSQTRNKILKDMEKQALDSISKKHQQFTQDTIQSTWSHINHTMADGNSA